MLRDKIVVGNGVFSNAFISNEHSALIAGKRIGGRDCAAVICNMPNLFVSHRKSNSFERHRP